MPSDKFRITTNNQSLRNIDNTFFDMTLSANLTVDESNDINALNDRRSAHNALERQRREYLNLKYQQLAEVLPSLKTKRRPSKATIVTSSLDFVTTTLKRESKYMAEIKKLRLENEKLRELAQSSSDTLKRKICQSEKKTVPSQEALCTKRKNSEVQLSPPLTPKSIKEEEKQERSQKKRMLNKEATAPEFLPSPLGPSVSQSSFTSSNFDAFSYAPSPLSTHDDVNNNLFYMNMYGHSQPFFPSYTMTTPIFGSLYGSSDDLSYVSSEQPTHSLYM